MTQRSKVANFLKRQPEMQIEYIIPKLTEADLQDIFINLREQNYFFKIPNIRFYHTTCDKQVILGIQS